MNRRNNYQKRQLVYLNLNFFDSILQILAKICNTFIQFLWCFIPFKESSVLSLHLIYFDLWFAELDSFIAMAKEIKDSMDDENEVTTPKFSHCLCEWKRLSRVKKSTEFAKMGKWIEKMKLKRHEIFESVCVCVENANWNGNLCIWYAWTVLWFIERGGWAHAHCRTQEIMKLNSIQLNSEFSSHFYTLNTISVRIDNVHMPHRTLPCCCSAFYFIDWCHQACEWTWLICRFPFFQILALPFILLLNGCKKKIQSQKKNSVFPWNTTLDSTEETKTKNQTKSNTSDQTSIKKIELSSIT